jgi:hypothetical protein
VRKIRIKQPIIDDQQRRTDPLTAQFRQIAIDQIHGKALKQPGC